VVAHSDVAPARKEDPGELFPWKCLSEYNIGLWPAGGFHALTEPYENALARFGYGLVPDVDVPVDKVVTAFQRHFRTAKLDGVWDEECGRILADLLAQSEAAMHATA
jgi:N-acetylmuramoyl-L-alanine amidase